MYNLICASSFIVIMSLNYFLEKSKKKEIILKVISIILFLYKSTYFIVQNVKGNLSVPIEISTITYFLMIVVLVFKIKSLYAVSSFFGIMAGLGYFAFYILFGFTINGVFSVKSILLGCLYHGYLLISGIFLFKNNTFNEIDRKKIWIAIFAMLSWALVFYDIEMRGITFIYYIIKPKFLFIFGNMSLNVLLLIAYYILLVIAFYFAVKLFIKLNNNYEKKLLKSNNILE